MRVSKFPGRLLLRLLSTATGAGATTLPRHMLRALIANYYYTVMCIHYLLMR